MRRLRTSIAILAFCLPAGPARAATTPPPADFAGVTLGTSLHDLKQRHPEVARNPDSDRKFQVYQTLALKGLDSKSPVAFSIYNGRVVGGQVMLDSNNARYWYDAMVDKYGRPDSCTYCTDPELVSANWMWGNGVRLHIGGEMLTLLTEQGATQREAWLGRDSATADKGDEESDLGEVPHTQVAHAKLKKKTRATPAAANQPPPTKWDVYYANARARFSRIMGWSK